MEKDKRNHESYVSVTARIDSKLVKEIDGIAEALYSSRTAILQICLNLGLEMFKKKRPELMQAVEAYQKRKDTH